MKGTTLISAVWLRRSKEGLASGCHLEQVAKLRFLVSPPAPGIIIPCLRFVSWRSMLAPRTGLVR